MLIHYNLDPTIYSTDNPGGAPVADPWGAMGAIAPLTGWEKYFFSIFLLFIIEKIVNFLLLLHYKLVKYFKFSGTCIDIRSNKISIIIHFLKINPKINPPKKLPPLTRWPGSTTAAPLAMMWLCQVERLWRWCAELIQLTPATAFLLPPGVWQLFTSTSQQFVHQVDIWN